MPGFEEFVAHQIEIGSERGARAHIRAARRRPKPERKHPTVVTRFGRDCNCASYCRLKTVRQRAVAAEILPAVGRADEPAAHRPQGAVRREAEHVASAPSVGNTIVYPCAVVATRAAQMRSDDSDQL